MLILLLSLLLLLLLLLLLSLLLSLLLFSLSLLTGLMVIFKFTLPPTIKARRKFRPVRDLNMIVRYR